MIGIIDTGASNLHSITAAIERSGRSVRRIGTVADIADVRSIILPGVGHAAHVMPRLVESGLAAALVSSSVPILGICLGMQLLFEVTEEGNVRGLGMMSGVCRAIPAHAAITVPHMGWNTVHAMRGPLFRSVAEGSAVYFVHRYAVASTETPDCLATVDHGGSWVAAAGRGMVYGVQFHPEKSGAIGARILQNFLDLS